MTTRAEWQHDSRDDGDLHERSGAEAAAGTEELQRAEGRGPACAPAISGPRPTTLGHLHLYHIIYIHYPSGCPQSGQIVHSPPNLWGQLHRESQ